MTLMGIIERCIYLGHTETGWLTGNKGPKMCRGSSDLVLDWFVPSLLYCVVRLWRLFLKYVEYIPIFCSSSSDDYKLINGRFPYDTPELGLLC